ncbi:MAG TPA: ATP-binding protein [Gemmatimonadaceae bacterium]|nr:ATP-binding protein [Gemmatimonadaceae bacterium]
MPLAYSRRIRTALWVSLIALLVPVSITLTELDAGGSRPWLRLISLLIVGGTFGLLLRRQGAFEARVRDQERVAEALRASEAKFSGILAIAADAIISVDRDHRIVHFNHGAEEIFGFTAAEAIGQHLNTLLPPRVRSVHEEHMARFGAGPETARRMGERRQIFGLRKGGAEFPAEASISKLDTPDGPLFTVVLRDVTERKRSEDDERFLSAASAELGRSLDFNEALRTVADLPVPRVADACLVDVLVAGDDFQRVASTRQREDLTAALVQLEAQRLTPDSPSPVVDVMRRKRTEVVERVDDDWLDANEDPNGIPHWRALGARSLLIVPLTVGENTFGAITFIAATQGRTFPPDRKALAEKYASAAATAIENARLYRVAQRATRARDEVLGIVSHDLRNPISAISMCARALEQTPTDDGAERTGLLVTIRESTDWMNRLIQDLLDVASIERGTLSLELREQDPAQIVLQARHMFDVEATSHGITLEAQVSTNLPPVTADGARVVQVLGNLLRNAIKFTPNGGRVVLRADHRDRTVVFSVTDTGRGIPLANQARVFDRYWQAAAGARAGGSGLGLSIAKGIVEAHGGEIWLASAPGQGSTFAFSLPVAMAQYPQ